MNDLINLLKAARTLEQFVTLDRTPELFATIEVEAARQAIINARHAKDPAAQVWTAVGHLETAFQAVRRDLRLTNTLGGALRLGLVPGHAVARFGAIARARYVLCLSAACYWYLQEDVLCERSVTLATNNSNFREPQDDDKFDLIAGGFMPIVYLIGLVQLPFSRRAEFFTLSDAEEVRALLTEKPR